MELLEYEKMFRFEDGNWWYQSKRELILKFVEQIARRSTCSRPVILDVGCGTGSTLRSLTGYGDAIGLDLSEEALKFSELRQVGSLVRGEFDSLPFKKEKFDLVLALDVLEHLDDDLASIKNVYYILKPGGYFIITVPAFNFLWSGHDAAMHHKRRYGKKDLVRRLKSCDFSVEICTFWNFFLFPAVAVIRVLRDRRRCDLITDLKDLPQIVNRLLLQILRVENILIGGGIPFPFGVSILCICRKGGN